MVGGHFEAQVLGRRFSLKSQVFSFYLSKCMCSL